MGGKKGGSGASPKEAPESGRSKQLVKIVEVVSEGEVEGFVDVEKSIFFDNTPLRNADGSFNFKNAEWQARDGLQTQEMLSGFNATEKEVSVSTEVKKATPITRTITDPKVNRVRLTLGVSSLFQQNDNGDTNGTNVDFKITVGSRVLPLTINGKYSSQYLRNIVIDNLPRTPFTIKVERVQEDSTSQRLQNKTLWASYTEIIDHQFTYPNTALIGIKFDSEYFSNIPTRTYDVLGIRVKVPSNYNPTTRQYSGLWDGSFKIAWTDNPAWILYDIVTNKRYGLGKRLGDFGADKWTLYQVAQYCDQLVPDGFGNREPRFTCNVWLTEQRSAYDVINDICSIFRAMPVWNGTTLTVIQDRPSDPVWTYTAANVIGGFSRQYSAMKARHNAIQVEYKDKENNYETAIEYISDDEAIRKYGLNLKKVQAFGCTSRGQAYRTGRWILETERLETETITFTVGAEGLMHLPGDIIRVADSHYAGTEIGGRIKRVSGNKVELDRPIDASFDARSALTLFINGRWQSFRLADVRGQTAYLGSTPVGAQENDIWSLTTQRIDSRLYRAMSVAENDDGSYTITALQHEPQKEAIVDNGATFEPRATTLHQVPKIEHLDVAVSAGNAGISWQAGSGSAIVSYDVKILKDGKLFALHKGLKSTELDLSDLPDGHYQIIITSRNASGQIIDEKSKTFTIDRPPLPSNVQVVGGLADVILSWAWVDEATQTEIWASQHNDLRGATRVAKVTANTYTHTVGSKQVRFYWLRHARGQNLGNWYQGEGLRAETGANIDEELATLRERLKAPLSQDVIETALPARNLELVKTVPNLAVPTQKQGATLLYNQADGKLYRWNGSRYTTAVPAADVEGIIPKSKLDNSLLAELTAATNNIAQERTDRTKAIEAESAKQARALQDEARARGTAITQLQREDERQAGMITTTTAKVEQALSGLEEERTARVNGDNAEAEARRLLTTRVGNAEGQLTTLQRTQVEQGRAITESTERLTARLDNFQVGGRNYALKSDIVLENQHSGESNHLNISQELFKCKPKAITISVFVEIRNNLNTAYGVRNRAGLSTRFVYDDGSTQWREVWVHSSNHNGRISKTFTIPDNKNLVGINFFAIQTRLPSSEHVKVWRPKIEIGTVATDWTPAPEDGETAISAVSAEITAYKQTQAEKERAQALKEEQVSAKLRGMEGNITTTSQAVAHLNGTVSALHTIKAQTIANGRTVMAGIALGANEKESSVIVMADKFAVVKNAQDGNPTSLFTVQQNQVAINGNLVANGSITAAKLAANSVETAHLTAGAIRADHLAAGQISADKMAIGLGGNLLYNPIFANNADGWTIANGSYTGGTPQRTYIGQGNDNWTLKNALSESERMVKLRMAETISTPKNQWIDVVRQKVRLVPNQWYMFSVYANAYRCSAMLLVEELNAEGRFVKGVASAYLHNRGTFANGVDANSRNFVKFRCPASGYVEVMVRANQQTSNNPDVYVARPMLEECTEHTTQPSAWQNAGVTSIHGGSIRTRTITAEQIGVGQITTEHMLAGSIDAKVLKAETVTARHVAVGISITSPQINAGTITGSRLNAGHIEGGSIHGTNVSGSTITGNTISGGTISGATITGNNISGGTISGTTIEGGVIRAAHFEGATGSFSGTLTVNQLIGSNILEVVKVSLDYRLNSEQRAGETKITRIYSKRINIVAAPVDRFFFVLNSDYSMFIPANQNKVINFQKTFGEREELRGVVHNSEIYMTVMLIAATSAKTVSF